MQPNGGLNTSLLVGIITPAQPLAPAASVNVQFLLGVERGGGYRIFINVEARIDAPASGQSVGTKRGIRMPAPTR